MHLFVIDAEQLQSGSDNNWEKIWSETGFLGKLQKLGGFLAYWDPQGILPPSATPAYSNYQQLLAYSQNQGCTVLVHLFADQFFLDTEIVAKGLMQIQDIKPDYFTQWEHCRLPLGIGIRAFSVKNLVSMTANSLKEAQKKILQNPQIFEIFYDPSLYVSYEQSMMDARFPPSRLVLLENSKVNFDLPGFLSLNADILNNEISPTLDLSAEVPSQDERGVAGAFGFESSHAAEFPPYIMFDLTNRCNAKCIHCPQSTLYADNKQGRAFLDFETFKQAIDECKGRKIQFIRITADGEPFVHPKLFDMIEYAVKADLAPVGLTTNGSLMTAPKAEWLVRSGLFMIDVSLDALTDETYSIVRKGLTFSKTVENLHHLLEFRKSVESPLKVMVSFVKQKANAHEVEGFERHWEKLVDKVLIRELITNVNQSTAEAVDVKGETAVKRWPCVHWFRRMVINYDGVLKPCPIDWQSGTGYRPLHETSIFDAWHSEFFAKHRHEHLNNRFSESSICKNCPDWQGTPWDLGYEKVIKTIAES